MNLFKFLRYEIFFVVREIYGTSIVLYLIKKHTSGDQKTIQISEMKHYKINFRNIQKIIYIYIFDFFQYFLGKL